MNAATWRGAARSKTVYLGLAVTIMGYLQANAQTLAPFVRPEILGLINLGLGAAIIVVRFLTHESLEDKGA